VPPERLLGAIISALLKVLEELLDKLLDELKLLDVKIDEEFELADESDKDDELKLLDDDKLEMLEEPAAPSST
jgi:hypothetical protein